MDAHVECSCTNLGVRTSLNVTCVLVCAHDNTDQLQHAKGKLTVWGDRLVLLGTWRAVKKQAVRFSSLDALPRLAYIHSAKSWVLPSAWSTDSKSFLLLLWLCSIELTCTYHMWRADCHPVSWQIWHTGSARSWWRHAANAFCGWDFVVATN